jgi:Tfp pilus assembly protein PilO
VNRNYRIIAVAIVALLAVGGYWKLGLAPKRKQVADLTQQVFTKQAEVAQSQTLLASYKHARGAYKTNYSTVVGLGKAVPAADDTRSLVVQLDAAAKRSGVSFDTIDVTPPDATAAAANAGSTFSAMPFSVSFAGSFGTLSGFVSRLQRQVIVQGDQIEVDGRLLRLEGITLQPGTDGWPELQAQITASAYIVPDSAAASTTQTPAATGATQTPSPSTVSDVR